MNGDKITQTTLMGLLEKQGYRCALTGRELEPETAALDHCLPVGRGGANDMSNVCIIHKDVNAAKGTMTTEEFIAMCQEVASHALVTTP